MDNKIHILLAQAKRESETATPEKSSMAFATREFVNEREAENAFQHLKRKLFRIDEWNEKSALSTFELYDHAGNEARGKDAAAEDFIKITLPGSGKSDWVEIIEIYEHGAEVVLTVQPSENPTEKNPGKKTHTSHFFTSEATNNFCLNRDGNSVNFFVLGLSEKSNTGDTSNFLETLRNYATANLGHYLGIQKGEWTTFCENFLDTVKTED
jgi:hypothetical protein